MGENYANMNANYEDGLPGVSIRWFPAIITGFKKNKGGKGGPGYVIVEILGSATEGSVGHHQRYLEAVKQTQLSEAKRLNGMPLEVLAGTLPFDNPVCSLRNQSGNPICPLIGERTYMAFDPSTRRMVADNIGLFERTGTQYDNEAVKKMLEMRLQEA